MSNETTSITTLAILQTTDLPPVPDLIEVVLDWGETTIVEGEPDLVGGETPKLVVGNHIMVRGTDDVIKDWFRQAGRVWVGKGSPMMQKFELWEMNQ